MIYDNHIIITSQEIFSHFEQSLDAMLCLIKLDILSKTFILSKTLIHFFLRQLNNFVIRILFNVLPVYHYNYVKISSI